MPTNTSIQSSLVAGNVPPDRECPKSMTDILSGVQDFMSVQTTSEDGTPSGPDNSIAEQALNTANTALAGVQSLQAAQKEYRVSGLIAISSGDTNFTFNFAPPMPSTDYDISLAYYAGATGYVGNTQLYNWRVLESSVSVNGFTLIFDNTPANTKVAIRVVQR